MAYGIRVENSSGFVQIDQDFVNYVLVASGSFSSNGTFSNPQDHVIDYDTLVSTPDTLLFARPTTTGNNLSSFAELVGELSGQNRVRITSAYTGTVQWRVYERASALTAPSTGYGLNVYRSDGTLAFSSDYKVPRVFSLVEATPTFGTIATVTHSYSSIPYGLMGNGYLWRYFYEEEPVPSIFSYVSIYWQDATTIKIEDFEVESFGGGTSDFIVPPATRAWAFIQE